MSNKERALVWSVFAVVSIIVAIANRGFQDTKWMLLAFLCVPVGYEIINYFVIRKRLRK